MIFPVIQFVLPVTLKPEDLETDNLSDIMFLATKEFDSKLRSNEGAVTTTGDLATLTAASGKDMYLASAKVNILRSDVAVVGQADVKVELKLNGVIIETWSANNIWNTDLVNISNDYEFKIGIGQKVTTGQIIKLEVITNDGNDANFEGSISCFEEDTGATPRLEAQSVGNVSVIAGLEGADIGFLAKKEFDGKIVEAKGTLSATGTLATLTASSGKDLYLAKAKVIVHRTTATTNLTTCVTDLRINGVTHEISFLTVHQIATGAGGTGTKIYEYAVSGVKVAATQTIILEVTTIDADCDVEGILTGWEETTGASPV